MATTGESVNALINMRSSTCLNESSAHPIAHCLIDNLDHLRSDADQQLLLSLHFMEPLHLSSLRFVASGDEAPKMIKLFANRHNMGFDDAESDTATQEAVLELEDVSETIVRLTPARFRSVHCLVIFIEENGGAEETSLRFLDVIGTRARGGSLLETKAPKTGKRQKASGGVLGEVASRLAQQSTEEGVAGCLLEVTMSVASAQGREIVSRASEIFLAAAKDSGERHGRALLMLGACRCHVLCLERGYESKPLPSGTRLAMRTAVQGLTSALEGVVGARELRPILQGLVSQGGHNLAEAMHLFCRIVEPIIAPACSRGQAGDESGDSESEVSEADDDEVGATGDIDAMLELSAISSNAVKSLDDAEKRKTRVSSFLEELHAEAAMVEDADSIDHGTLLQAHSPLEEFLAHMAVVPAAAEKWPIIYPGPGSHILRFDAKFEGGNLRRVREQSDGGVEILLCGDTNRSYHCQSFFFDVYAIQKIDLRVRIVTFVKPGSTFAAGQRIVTKSPGANGWRRDGHDYAYVPNRYMIGQRGRNYTLAFTLSLLPGCTRVAHFYPYLFGDLLCDLRRLQPSGDWLNIQDLGPTPNGRPLLMLTITNFEPSVATGQIDKRPHIIISARVHPGETPASFMMRGVIQLLLSSTSEADILRRRFIFTVFPMLNPDGVAAGNGRANSTGHDLNRCWAKPPPGSEIAASKRVVQDLCSSPGGVLAFLDLHAHSRRHGVFTLSNPRTQALPDLLASVDHAVFDRRQCVFSYNKSKRSSARCVAWKEFGVKHAHTVEATYAAMPGRSRLVLPGDLTELGQNLVRACAKLQEEPGALM